MRANPSGYGWNGILSCTRHQHEHLLLFGVMITFVICAQMLSCSNSDVLLLTWMNFVHWCGHNFVTAVMSWLSAPTQRIMVQSELLHKCRRTRQQYSTQCPICRTVQGNNVKGLVLSSQQVPTNATYLPKIIATNVKTLCLFLNTTAI